MIIPAIQSNCKFDYADPMFETFKPSELKIYFCYQHNCHTLFLMLGEKQKERLSSIDNHQSIHFTENGEYEFVDNHQVIAIVKSWQLKVEKHEKFT